MPILRPSSSSSSAQLLIVLHLIITCFYSSSFAFEERFSETLLISPLPNDDLLSIFNFTIFSGSESGNKNSSVFVPWLIQDLFNRFHISTFHLSFTQGFWRTNLWGLQYQGTEVPSGTQLAVKFTSTKESSYERWSDLVHTINGLFCTSILGMLPQFSGQPKYLNNDSSGVWWHGALGGESLCTENLKYWKKILPCKQSGLVMLIEPTALLAEKFHSISLQIKKDGTPDLVRWSIIVLAKTVHNGHRLGGGNGDYSIQTIFDAKLTRKCPVVEQSRVKISHKLNLTRLSFAPTNSTTFNLLIFDLDSWDPTKGAFFLEFATGPSNRENKRLSSISVFSMLKGNQLFGRLCTLVNNPHDFPVLFTFTQTIPWQIRVFLHTLTLSCSSGTKMPFNISFSLARDRKWPLLVELQAKLPEQSQCKIEMDYEPAFLRITDFPPDANSGIFIPGAILTIPFQNNKKFANYLNSAEIGLFELTPSDTNSDQFLRLYAEPLLVLLPVPDFSMPFNVICLVCTIIAIFYGNAVALSTKLMKPVPKEKEAEDKQSQTVLQRLKGRISAGWASLIARFPGRSEKSKRE